MVVIALWYIWIPSAKQHVYKWAFAETPPWFLCIRLLWPWPWVCPNASPWLVTLDHDWWPWILLCYCQPLPYGWSPWPLPSSLLTGLLPHMYGLLRTLHLIWSGLSSLFPATVDTLPKFGLLGFCCHRHWAQTVWLVSVGLPFLAKLLLSFSFPSLWTELCSSQIYMLKP